MVRTHIQDGGRQIPKKKFGKVLEDGGWLQGLEEVQISIGNSVEEMDYQGIGKSGKSGKGNINPNPNLMAKGKEQFQKKKLRKKVQEVYQN